MALQRMVARSGSSSAGSAGGGCGLRDDVPVIFACWARAETRLLEEAFRRVGADGRDEDGWLRLTEQVVRDKRRGEPGGCCAGYWALGAGDLALRGSSTVGSWQRTVERVFFFLLSFLGSRPLELVSPGACADSVEPLRGAAEALEPDRRSWFSGRVRRTRSGGVWA